MSGKKEKKISLSEELKKICLQTGKESYTPKMNLLCQLLEKPPRKPSEILLYHDCLLAMLAYPSGRQLYLLTLQSLNALIIYLKKIAAEKNDRLQYALSGTGLSSSSIIGSFSFEIAKWLSAAFPHDTEIESSLADPESVRLFFREILPRTEYENIFTGELNLVKRSLLLKGETRESVLSWLLHHIDNLQVPERDKESIFHNLQIFINWKLNHSFYNRTMLQSTGHPVYYHKSLRKKAQIHRVANKPVPAPVHLTKTDKTHLINIARATLICLHRETEPFTYADPAEIIRFDLERGLTVVLYGMSKERRLSIESYIGY
ncbi:MAG TPA: hypothetical protein VFV31_02240, partial [Chitinophagaceae bacterium]|nr:hypothetical protein [Chitinophagaceae bacterium]